MENKKVVEKNNLVLIIVGIIIVMMFFYFGYKMEIGNYLTYKDAVTGEVLQDIGGKKICYIILTILSIYTIVATLFLNEKFKSKEIKVENVFLCIVPIFCLLLTLAMPMSKGHDETIHGLRIYEYAEGKFISNGEKAYLEEGVINALDNKNTYNDIFDKKNNYSTNTETIEWGYRIATYSPINYLPQVIGIFVSRFITSNSIVHLYVARICNIIACITMLYFAIKLIPFGKNLLFLFSLIPISIEGFSTLSADGMLLASSFLWISYILNICFTEGKIVKWKDIIILSILAITISLSKTIYIVLLLLLLLIPKEKWKNTKIKILVISLIFIISAILDIGWYFIGIKNETLITGNSAASYIIQNPIGYIQRIIYTIFINFGKYVGEIFGKTIEWNEQIIINVFPYVLLAISIILTINGKEKINWTTWQKIVISIIILSGTFLVFTSMFLAWAKFYTPHIDGVQGRYLMPFVPLIFLLFGRKFSDDRNLTKTISIVGLIMQVYVVMELVLYHI